ncbi:MAG: type II toxin-antitoxin system RelE/ParE family toxin [Fimbriiglobus sp.]
MSLLVVFRLEAEVEFDEAFDWYNAQRPGLGSEFVEAVQSVLASISRSPFQHAVVIEDIRKAVVQRFPYCLYYRTHDDRIEIISVFHSRRDPSVWKSRI